MVTFIIFAHANSQGFLQTFVDIFHGSGDLPDERILVNTDFSIREKSVGKIHVGLPHITGEILYPKPFCLMQISRKELIGLVEFLSARADITPLMKNKIAVF